MDALILKPYWGKAILYGKDWEIRSRDTKKRGPVAIVTSGDHKVLGFTCFTDRYRRPRTTGTDMSINLLTQSRFYGPFITDRSRAPSYG